MYIWDTMAAPKENKFWQLRSKHGRDKLFASPELLWEAACEYFDWCYNNPLIEIDYKGKDRVKIPKMRAYTVRGLCLYLGCSKNYFEEFEKALTGKEDLESQDFLGIVARIKDTIYTQKFEGAAADLLNSNIIARELGLTDKTESDINLKGEVKQITGMEIY